MFQEDVEEKESLLATTKYARPSNYTSLKDDFSVTNIEQNSRAVPENWGHYFFQL